MLGNFGISRAHFLGCSLTLMLLFLSGEVHARGYTVLHAFTGPPTDGANPLAGLIEDQAGNFYGTTFAGGSFDTCAYGAATGCGTVFKLSPDGSETVLHDFGNSGDGTYPRAGLIEDKKGNLYGTTWEGGAYGESENGYGTIFRVNPDGTEKILHSFAGGPSDGDGPVAGLIRDMAGNFYGTTVGGGASGRGTVFKLAADGTETVLISFTGGSDGSYPGGGLIADDAGNFYGTTGEGGVYGFGTVFKLAPDGTETVLYSFGGTFSDGAAPAGSVIMGGQDNLYGTTSLGGEDGYGTVFKLAPDGTETVLHYFTAGSDGAYPYGNLVADKSGNLYGTTSGGAYEKGTVFKVTSDGTENVLHAFKGGYWGHPYAGLIIGTSGDLYGTALGGEQKCSHHEPRHCGIVFKLAK